MLLVWGVFIINLIKPLFVSLIINFIVLSLNWFVIITIVSWKYLCVRARVCVRVCVCVILLLVSSKSAPCLAPSFIAVIICTFLLQGHKPTACIWGINVTFPTLLTQTGRKRIGAIKSFRPDTVMQLYGFIGHNFLPEPCLSFYILKSLMGPDQTACFGPNHKTQEISL